MSTRARPLWLAAALAGLLAFAACQPPAPTATPTPLATTATTAIPPTAAPAATATPTPPASATPWPSPTTTLAVHRWESAPVLVELYETGFMFKIDNWLAMPDLVLYADGRLVTAHRSYDDTRGYYTATETLLSPSQVCALLTQVEANGFFEFGREDYDIQVIDYPTTYLTVNAWRSRRFAAWGLSYALGPRAEETRAAQDIPPGLAATYLQLIDLAEKTGVPYRPDKLAVNIDRWDYGSDVPTPPWPLSGIPLAHLTVRSAATGGEIILEGDEAAAIYGLMGDDWTHRYSEDGQIYDLSIRPILPYETWTDPADLEHRPYAYELEPTMDLQCVSLPTPSPTPAPIPSPATLRLVGEIGRPDDSGEIDWPWSFVVTPRDEIVVNDSDSWSYPLRQRLVWFALDGTFLKELPLPPDNDRIASGLTNGIDGTILIAYSGQGHAPDRIIELAQDGTIVRTFEGWRAPEPNRDIAPRRHTIAQGPDGAIYLAEECGNRVVILHSDGRLREIWNDPQANPFTCIDALATDSHGNLYVAEHDDWKGPRLLRRRPTGEVQVFPIHVWSGIVPLEDGSFYVSEEEGVVHYSPAGEELGRSSGEACDWPHTSDLARASDGSLVISGAGRIPQRCTLDGRLLTTIGVTESRPPAFELVDAFAVSSRGDIWLVDSTYSYPARERKRLVHLDAAGNHLATFDDIDGDPLAGGGYDYYLAAHSDGSVFLVDGKIGIIRRIGPDGRVRQEWDRPEDFGYISGIAVAPDERSLYVADWPGKWVRQFDLAGQLLSTWNRSLGTPAAVTADESGTLYVLGGTAQRVVVVSPSGEVRSWPLPSLPHARDIEVSSIAVDAARGRIYVAANYNMVYVFDLEGVFLGTAMVGSSRIGGNYRGLTIACAPHGRVYVSLGGDRIYVYEPVP